MQPCGVALLCHEYFHGVNGVGLAAMHHTGWTALVVDLILDPGRSHRMIFHDDPVGEEPTSTTARTRKRGAR